MATLADVALKSILIDENTTDDGEPIRWQVVSQGQDGEGITTLMRAYYLVGGKSYGYMVEHEYDAAEPENPISSIQSGGNADYEKSNILQWLNSNLPANQWFSKQHSYDVAPSYVNKAGFLTNFSQDLLDNMNIVTKMGVSRKVHLPGAKEIAGAHTLPSVPSTYTNSYDAGVQYSGASTVIPVDKGFAYVRNTGNPDPDRIMTFKLDGSDKMQYQIMSALQVRYSSSYSVVTIPCIYVNSNIPVIYNSTAKAYYTKFDIAPTVTIDSNLGQHKTTFNFSFTVNDEESDIVSVNAYVDNTAGTAFYSNNNVTLNTPITTAIPTATYDTLNYGNHKIIIVASDGQKTTTVESSFEKFDIAPSITVDSSFGQKKYTFGFVFRVVDADDTSSNVTVELEGTQLYSDTVALDTDITVNIPANVFEALSIGQHTITITASDGIKTGTATPTFQRIEISAPVITCEDVGNVINGFTTYYQVYDEDGGTVDVNIKLNGATISSATDVSQQVDIPITISDAQVTGLSYGAHSILITATDSDNYTSTRTINFNKKSTPYVAIVNPTIGDVTAPFDIVVNYNSPDGDEVTVKAVIDGTIEV